jgi:Cu/Ag efflux protein CusF
MRKIFVFSAAALLGLAVLSVPAAAQQSSDQGQTGSKMQSSGNSIRGTISRVDPDTKMVVIRDESGSSTTVYWDASTRVSGGSASDLKEGQTVTINTTQSQGKTMATSITMSGSGKSSSPSQ